MNEVAEKTGRKSRAEWVELMAAYEGGDLTQRAFCKMRGVAYRSLGYWRKRLCSPAVLSGSASEPLVGLSAHLLTRLKNATPKQRFVYVNEVTRE